MQLVAASLFDEEHACILWADRLLQVKQALHKSKTTVVFHREEIKKINRDKAQLSERLKEAEGAQLRLDGEVHSLKAAAAVSGERHDASMAQLEKRLQRAQEAVQAKQDEVTRGPGGGGAGAGGGAAGGAGGRGRWGGGTG